MVFGIQLQLYVSLGVDPVNISMPSKLTSDCATRSNGTSSEKRREAPCQKPGGEIRKKEMMKKGRIACQVKFRS